MNDPATLEELYELALADLIDQFARGLRQTRHDAEPLAWRPEEIREGAGA